MVYWSYYTFGQTLIDKTAVSSGLRDRFTYEFDGIENLNETLANKQGGVLISAHMGNFEIAEDNVWPPSMSAIIPWTISFIALFST